MDLATYFRSEYTRQGLICSLGPDEAEQRVRVRRRVVDGRYGEVSVPATRTPTYGVGEGVHLVPIRNLDQLGLAEVRWMLSSRLNAGSHAGLLRNLRFMGAMVHLVPLAEANLARLRVG